jgi:hypothetical protein
VFAPTLILRYAQVQPEPDAQPEQQYIFPAISMPLPPLPRHSALGMPQLAQVCVDWSVWLDWPVWPETIVLLFWLFI